MNISRWIALYKNKKKESLLKEMNPSYKYKYAFVGVGQHSLSVFYPILNFIQTPLKYILTQQSSLGNLLLSKFPGATATNNYHQILDDPEIKGIFICSHPSSHFKLIEQALKHNKHVFVEKPPCSSLTELTHLISVANTHCVVGLQKSYNIINKYIKTNYKKPLYYYARYGTGNYPEGNPVTELFIHPIDNIIQLFGPASIKFSKKINNGQGVIYIIHLHHLNTEGIIELTTDSNWNNPTDSLRLEMHDKEIKIHYPNYIASLSKEKNIAGIPINKVFPRAVIKKIIYDNRNPVGTLEKNVLFESGYFQEIKQFISNVEQETNIFAPSDIRNLRNTYKILDEMSVESTVS